MQRIALKDKSSGIFKGSFARLLDRPWGGYSLIGSHADDKYGIGNILIATYDELKEIEYKPDREDGDGAWKIVVETTEGKKAYYCFDVVFLNDLEEWAKEFDVHIIKTGFKKKIH